MFVNTRSRLVTLEAGLLEMDLLVAVVLVQVV